MIKLLGNKYDRWMQSPYMHGSCKVQFLESVNVDTDREFQHLCIYDFLFFLEQHKSLWRRVQVVATLNSTKATTVISTSWLLL